MHNLARWKIRSVKPYVPGKPIEELTRELGIKGEIIKLASNENPLGPSPKAMEMVSRYIKELNLYPDDSAYSLTKKIAEMNGLSTDEVILGNGSVEIMQMIDLAFVNPGESIVTSEKSFSLYKIIGDIVGARVIETPMKDGKIDLNLILEGIKEDTKVVFIDNPTNPMGTLCPKDEVEDFMKRVPEDVIVVWDEAYYEYARGEHFKETIDYVKQGRNVIVLRTFSKVYGLAGLRLGYAFAKKEIIDALGRTRLPFNVNTMAQIAAYYALEDTEHVRKSVEMNSKGLEYLYEEFSKMNLKFYRSWGNFILVDLGINSDKPYNFLLKKGIIVRPVKNYSLPTCLRITVGTPSQNQKLVEGLKEFLEHGYS
ncbi:MAG TPA: histidinol-phosphate transaminase [Candidatus Hydrothermia bacterium]|nr:histidinol-phosphate transaminase [Candidatus Hydrothermia bacterium]